MAIQFHTIEELSSAITDVLQLGDDDNIFTADIHYQSTNIGTKHKASPFWT